MSIDADAQALVMQAHRAQLAHMTHLTRLEDEVRTLEEVLATKRVALDRARESHGDYLMMTRDAMDLLRYTSGPEFVSVPTETVNP